MTQNNTVATLQSKEDAWSKASIREDRYAIDPNFRWTTMDCQTLKLQEMATPHLFNCIKMMWNNLVPAQYRVGHFTEYKTIPKMPRKTRAYAIANLFYELMNRNDRTPGMNEALERMYSYMQKNHELKSIKR
jgi:hypothetical protein